MKIGIVSDSHKKIGLLSDAIERLVNDGAEFLIHAGDIVLKESLDLLENSTLPYQVVLGNNDTHLLTYVNDYSLEQEPFYFKIKDLSVKLMHLPYYLNSDSDLIIYGHTHYFEAEKKQNSLYINPGEICARKKPISEFVMLQSKKNKWIVKHYQKELSQNKKDYSIDSLEFKRGDK